MSPGISNKELLGDDLVLLAYRLLLGRDPESEQALRDNPYRLDRVNLVASFMRSEEFRAQFSGTYSPDIQNPYDFRNVKPLVFFHLQKTGGTSLLSALKACFDDSDVCEQRSDAFHLYSPSELCRFKLFSGHFDYYSLNYLPFPKCYTASIFRDPVDRLISMYRFKRSFSDNNIRDFDSAALLANKLTPVEFFTNEIILNSTGFNNYYFFMFGSSLVDADGLGVLRSIQTSGEGTHALVADNRLRGALKTATQRVRKLDMIGLTESLDSSLPVLLDRLPAFTHNISNIKHLNVTDELPKEDPAYKTVQVIEKTSELLQALDPLIVLDRVIYRTACGEFEKRKAAYGKRRSRFNNHRPHKNSKAMQGV